MKLTLVRHAVVIVLAALPAFSIAPRHEFYVFNVKPPSITVVDSDNLEIVGTMPLEPGPSYAVMGANNRFLYVLHNGPMDLAGKPTKAPSELAILDTDTRKQVKKIPLGWNVTKMSFTANNRYLLCFSQGRPERKKLKQEPASVTVVDTRSNEVVVTLSAGRLGKQILFTDDASRIFVLSKGEESGKKKKSAASSLKPALTVFALEDEESLAVIEFTHDISEMVLSSDQNWLYLLDKGNPSKKPKKHRNGRVHAVDVAAAKLVDAHDVGADPRGLFADGKAGFVSVLSLDSVKSGGGILFQLGGHEVIQQADVGPEPMFMKRLGDLPGQWVLSEKEMRFVPDKGTVASSFIALNPKKEDGKSPGEEIKKIGGYPGELLYLRKQNKIVMAVNQRSPEGMIPGSKVALVDLQSGAIQHVIKTGRGSVRFGKFMGAMALSAAMTYLSYQSSYSMARATGSNYFFYRVYVFTPAAPNLSLAASPDERYIYVLNTMTNDVTIIDVSAGLALDKIPVGGSCQRISLTPGGRFIYSKASKNITLIDTQSNKLFLQHKLSKGNVNALHMDEERGRLLALTTDALLVFDAEEGELLRTVEGFSEPHMVLHPRAAEGVGDGRNASPQER